MKNVRDYVKVYDNFLDKDFCQEIIKSIEKVQWKKHTFYQYSLNQEIALSKEKELSIAYTDSYLKNILEKQVWYAIEKYILKDFECEWFSGWNGYSSIRFNKYDKNTKMAKHCDHIHSMFDGQIKGIPTLSIVGCLNSDYEGGKFIMWENEEVKIPEGSILIFPSNFMYPHKVTEVTKGTRYSYVSWVY